MFPKLLMLAVVKQHTLMTCDYGDEASYRKVFYWIYSNITCVHFHTAPPVLVPQNGKFITPRPACLQTATPNFSRLCFKYCHIDGFQCRDICKRRHRNSFVCNVGFHRFVPTAIGAVLERIQSLASNFDTKLLVTC